MTTIDTSPDAAVDAEHTDHVGSFFTSVASWATTSDHKRIGRLFVSGSLVGLLAVAVVGVLLGIERTDGSDVVLGSALVPELFQAFRIGLVFAVMIPFGIGLSIAVVPLQLGARALAFPRVALAGFYGWVAGVALVVVALANDGGIGGSDVDMVGLFLLGHALLALGLLAAAGALAASVLTTRAPGMTMRRVPFLAWSALVAALGLLISLPVMIGTIIYLFVDYRNVSVVFGGSEGIGVWLGWVFTQPTTYLFAIPALGVFADVVPVTFRRRQLGRGVVFAGLALVGTAAFAGVTQQGVFNLPWSGSGVNLDGFGDKLRDLVPFALFNLLPLLGVVTVLAMGLLTAKPTKGGPRPRITSAFVFAFFGLGMILVGVAGNVLYAIDDLALQGTVFEEGVLVYVAYGSVLGAIGGLIHWSPKLWGRCLPDKAMYPLALVGVTATVLASLPYYVAGFADQPAGSAVYSYSGPDSLWNLLVLIGHVLMALTVLAVIALALRTFTGDGEAAGDDPWDAHTIEWAAPSPAPGNNFADVPLIGSSEPLLDLKPSTTASDGSQS